MDSRLEIGRVESDTSRRYSLREAARILEVPVARLRALTRAGFWESQRGPIGPVSFGFQDLLLLRTTRGLLESGVPMRKIRRTWTTLREQLAAGLPLTSITVHADGEEIVATDGNASWRPDSGQILLNFETSEIAERAKDVAAPVRPRITLAPRPAHTDPAAKTVSIADALASSAGASLWTDPDYRPTADEWYELGCELEATEPERALEAYQRAAELDPELAATVLFYPSQPTFDVLDDRKPVHPIDLLWNVRCPLLLLLGDQDPVITADVLAEVQRRLDVWNVAHEIRLYPGAGHAFCTDFPGFLHEEAARQARADALAFVGRNLDL